MVEISKDLDNCVDVYGCVSFSMVHYTDVILDFSSVWNYKSTLDTPEIWISVTVTDAFFDYDVALGNILSEGLKDVTFLHNI